MSDYKPNQEGRGDLPPRRRDEPFRVTLPPEAEPAEEDKSISNFSSPQAAGGPPRSREEEKRAKKAHKRRNKEKSRRNRRVFRLVWVVMVLFLGLALAQYLIAGLDDMLAVGRPSLTVTVEIPENASAEEVAQTLRSSGVIRNEDFFLLYAMVTKADDSFNQGTYELETDMDYEAIINYLQSDFHRVDTVRIQFREGLNVMEIARLFEENGVCTAEEILALANSDTFDGFDMISAITNDSERYYRLEGYLFPDTYDFYLGEDPEDALKKLLRQADKVLLEEYDEEIAASGMTMDEVMTLASIIQAESANEDDMYNVSSVLHNRLENGAATGTAQLGCDATVFYPYRTREDVPESVRETFASRYNTYQIIGLPPGPICNPGRSAIEAALQPNDTGYYYFCHDADGNAYYAVTAEEHQQNLVEAGLA